ncbi:uncharacterized protein C8A04DRAFT_13477 [Dichotomopilus funicola]|uniref:Zn(2)-C6 fungal-type domain-containing protein n=1 Tax=Dichotomopilus funicola TaxID=1934379 RepID=A0AAN6UZW7_9PEZI|nr:hypothetical protein C8A04DRAFT_13477 [Dichotomopilus funicola]
MPPMTRRRRRPALSCRECRRRKIRCDHNSPCTHCVRNQSECVYRPFADDGPVVVAAAASESLAAARAAGATAAATTTTTTTDASPTLLARSEAASVAPTRDRDRDRDPEANPDPHLDDDHDHHHDTSNCNRTSNCHRGPDRNDGPLSNQSHGWQPELKVREWGRTRWVGDSPEFATIISCYAEIMGKTTANTTFRRPETAALIAEASAALQGCKAVAKGMKVVRPTRGQQQGMTGQNAVVNPGLPSRDVAGEMARAYFASFESTHRILHAPTFWADFHRYWADPTGVTDEVRHTIFLVVGIGSSIHHSPHATAAAAAAQHNTDAVHHWIYAAETWLSGPLEKDRLDVAGLQVHCLAILARQIFSIGGDTVWVSMGSLLHSAMQIGMHRDPRHLPAMSVLQAELRRRLWATILDLIVQSSLDAWMPPRIALDEFDVEAPANVDDDEMDETTTTVPAAAGTALKPYSHPRDVVTDTSVQLALLDSLPTRLRIVHFLNSFRKDRSYSRALALTAELTDSIHANTVFFSQGMANQEKRNNAFHRDMLDYLTRRFLLPLHFPFSHQARTNPLFYYSRKVSLDAALALISGVVKDPDLNPPSTTTNPNPASDPTHTRHTTNNPPSNSNSNSNSNLPPSNTPPSTFTRLLTTAGSGMFRDGMRCATAALALELLAHADTQRRRDGSWHRTRALRDTLAGEIRGLIAMAARRMRNGAETNVKAHMFLEMVLAQVGVEDDFQGTGEGGDAGKEGGGRGVERAVAEAARDSLVFAEGVLRGRAEESEYGFAADGLFQGFDFDGFGEEFAWESLFPDSRFC